MERKKDKHQEIRVIFLKYLVIMPNLFQHLYEGCARILHSYSIKENKVTLLIC